MRISYETLKCLVSLAKTLNTRTSIDIEGTLLLTINKKTVDLGSYNIQLIIENSKLRINADEAQERISSALNLKKDELGLYWDNLLWLYHIDIMTVKVNNNNKYIEILKELLEAYCSQKKCKCLDIIYFNGVESQTTIKYFKGGFLSKVYISKDSKGGHINIVDMTLEKFIKDNPYARLLAVHENYETPDLEVNFKQQVRNCVKNNVSYSRIKLKEGVIDC